MTRHGANAYLDFPRATKGAKHISAERHVSAFRGSPDSLGLVLRASYEERGPTPHDLDRTRPRRKLPYAFRVFAEDILFEMDVRQNNLQDITTDGLPAVSSLSVDQIRLGPRAIYKNGGAETHTGLITGVIEICHRQPFLAIVSFPSLILEVQPGMLGGPDERCRSCIFLETSLPHSVDS